MSPEDSDTSHVSKDLQSFVFWGAGGLKNSALESQMKNKNLKTRPLTAAFNESDPMIYCGCDDFTAAPILRKTAAAFIFKTHCISNSFRALQVCKNIIAADALCSQLRCSAVSSSCPLARPLFKHSEFYPFKERQN